MDKMPIDLISTISPTLNSIQKTLPELKDKSLFYQDFQFWAIITALFLGIIGIFQENIRRLFQKPKLIPQIHLSPPDCHKIPLTNSATGQRICDTYYFRFRVTNEGNTTMEDIEVLAAELYEKNPSGRFIKVNNFLPINLVWAHNHVVTMTKIQPKLFKHCDFGHIIETRYANLAQFGINSQANIVFVLDTFVQPNTGSNLILPGDYKIKIIFSANNVKPKEVWYRLKLEDAWDNNEDVMFQNNVSIKKI